MAVEFLDPLGRGGKTEQYSRWYLLVFVVVLVERADSQYAAGLGPIFDCIYFSGCNVLDSDLA